MQINSKSKSSKILPFVSIVVPAYNSEKTIGRCLEALLKQNYPNFEIIAVDNNSTDNTGKIIQAYAAKDSRVKYVFEQEVSSTKARLKGVKCGMGDFIATIDSDCFATKDWISIHVNALLDDDNLGVVVGRTKVEPGKKLIEKYYSSLDPFNFEKFLDQDWIPWGQGNNCYRKKVFELAGYYDTRLRWGAGREFHKRLMEKTNYKIKYVPEAVIYHEARGSLKELFKVSAKYSNSTIMRVKIYKNKYLIEEARFMIIKKLVKLSICSASIAYGFIKFLIGKASVERLVYPIFYFVQLSGSIYGSFIARAFSKQVK